MAIYGGTGDDIVDPGSEGYLQTGYIYGGSGKDLVNLIGANVALYIEGNYYYGGLYYRGVFIGSKGIQASKFGDTIYGGELGESLYGADGMDTISGNGGNDYIRGGKGIDSLNGGAGVDRFEYRAVEELGDTVGDFVTLEDRFLFKSSQFGNLAIGLLDPAKFVRGLTNVAVDSDDYFRNV